MAPNSNANSNPYIVLFMGAFMIWGGIKSVTLPAGEYPMPPMHLIEMGIDLAMTVLMPVLLIASLPKAPPSWPKSLAFVVGWVAVLAGIVHLGARFAGNHGWWTGHYIPN